MPCLQLTGDHTSGHDLKEVVGLPCGPVVRTLHSQCWERKFDPWSGNQDPACRTVQPKKKTIVREKKRSLEACL